MSSANMKKNIPAKSPFLQENEDGRIASFPEKAKALSLTGLGLILIYSRNWRSFHD